MKYNNNGSWLKISHWCPFRVKYLYWDIYPYLGDTEFKKFSVRFTHKEFKNKKYDYVGVIITCWEKDEEKLQKALNKLDKRILTIKGENYESFLNKWKTHVIDFLKK